jgi:hypothetical protein
MQSEHESPNRFGEAIAERLNPAPPPPMPNATHDARMAEILRPPAPMPTAAPVEDKTVVASSTAAPAGSGWEVDPRRITYFARLVEDVRHRLREVQLKVDRMQDGSFTPRLGGSPAGQQLEKKFADRLDAPLDDPTNPTTGGLRALLTEAMRRMEEFIAGAEAAAKTYTEQDLAAADNVSKAGQSTGSTAGH